jgi:hypothetical protein
VSFLAFLATYAVTFMAAATTVVAAKLSKQDTRHRPVLGYAVLVFAANVVRHTLNQVLLPLDATSGPPPPREGFDLILWFADKAAYISLIVAIPALAMALFLRLRPWIMVAAGGALWLLVVGAYPALRGPVLLEMLWLAELAGGIAAAGMFVMWRLSSKRDELPAISVWCGIMLVGASLATTVLPSLAGEKAADKWPVVPAVHVVAFTVVLVLQARVLIAARKEKAHV